MLIIIKQQQYFNTAIKTQLTHVINIAAAEGYRSASKLAFGSTS